MNRNRPLLFALSLSGLMMAASPALARDPVTCTSDADCDSGLYCELRATPPCLPDEECPVTLEGSCTSGGSSSSCSVDADCPGSFTCEVVGGSGCMASPGGEPSNCETQEQRACVAPQPRACDPANASACSSDELCVTYTYESCSGEDTPAVACEVEGEGASNCAPPQSDDPPTCETRTQSYCVPPFVAPCEVDADCGLGFTCEARESCQGSCTSVDCGPDEEDCSSQPSDCSESCEPTGERSCELIETPCDSNADCSAGLSCVDVSDYMSSPPRATPEPDDCVSTSTGEIHCDESPPRELDAPEATNYCLPDGWERIFEFDGLGGDGEDSSGVIAPGPGEGWELIDAERATPLNPSSPNNADGDAGGFCGGNSVVGSSAAPGLLGLMSLLGMMGFRRRRNR